MNKFHYKFDSVRKVKEIQEKKVQKEIALLELEIENFTQALNILIEQKQKVKSEASSKKSMKISELQFFDQQEQLLEMKAKEFLTNISRLTEEKKIKIADLQQKTKEHKIFDLLEEKHYESFLTERNQFEQKEIDEMATTKFIRGE